MRHRHIYRQDPHWTIARYIGRCAECGRTIRPGERIFYYPLTRAVYCEAPCGEFAAADFGAHVFDEDAQAW